MLNIHGGGEPQHRKAKGRLVVDTLPFYEYKKNKKFLKN
jgi:hypothetical protein